jgi:nucleoside-diphosphate-sugar epimerase
LFLAEADSYPLCRTVSDIWELISGKLAGKDSPPEPRYPVFVNNEDLAVAHVKAIEKPVAKNNRYMTVGPNLPFFFIFSHYALTDAFELVLKIAGKYYTAEAVEILYRHFPQHAARFPKRQPNFKRPASVFDIDSSKARNQLLERDFISFEETVVDTVNRLFEIERKLQAK